MLLLHEEGGMGRFSRSGAGSTSYRMDVVEEVEEYYCVKGRSFAAISRETGIAASTLKRWSALFGWQESKRRLRNAAVSLRIRTVLALADLVKEARDTGVFNTKAFGKIVAEAGFKRRRDLRHRAIVGG